MAKTNRSTNLLEQEMLTANGYQSIGTIVAEMQTAGTDQRLIDRWLQGLETGMRVRRAA